MAKIGFIGLGNMGLPMAQNLIKAGHAVTGLDVSKAQTDKLVAAGGTAAANVKDATLNAEFVVTHLPDSEYVREVYLRSKGVIECAIKGAVLIDSSTIEVETARSVAAAANKAGLHMLDAPISGGVGGAQAGTLTFMVGGPPEVFERARPILEKMGKSIVHAGRSGNGQAAKICNNMILGVSMIAVSEAFVLAEKLGLEAQKLFEISSKSSSQCWSMTAYCPIAGPVPASPANRDYQPGFSATMMLRDLNLSQDAAKSTGAQTQLGSHAAQMYSRYVETGNAERDFSGIIRLVRGSR